MPIFGPNLTGLFAQPTKSNRKVISLEQPIIPKAGLSLWLKADAGITTTNFIPQIIISGFNSSYTPLNGTYNRDFDGYWNGSYTINFSGQLRDYNDPGMILATNSASNFQGYWTPGTNLRSITISNAGISFYNGTYTRQDSLDPFAPFTKISGSAYQITYDGSGWVLDGNKYRNDGTSLWTGGWYAITTGGNITATNSPSARFMGNPFSSAPSVNSVTSWADQSGSLRTATGEPQEYGICSPATIGGRSFVDFRPSARLNLQSTIWPETEFIGTIFSVARFNYSASPSNSLLFYEEADASNFSFSRSAPNNLSVENTSGSEHTYSNVFPENDTNYILATTFNASTASIYMNGVLTGSGARQSQIGLTANAQIGGDSGGFSLAETIIYDRVLSASERQKVEKYLGDKYGIATSLPAIPPIIYAEGNAAPYAYYDGFYDLYDPSSGFYSQRGSNYSSLASPLYTSNWTFWDGDQSEPAGSYNQSTLNTLPTARWNSSSGQFDSSFLITGPTLATSEIPYTQKIIAINGFNSTASGNYTNRAILLYKGGEYGRTSWSGQSDGKTFIVFADQEDYPGGGGPEGLKFMRLYVIATNGSFTEIASRPYGGDENYLHMFPLRLDQWVLAPGVTGQLKFYVDRAWPYKDLSSGHSGVVVSPQSAMPSPYIWLKSDAGVTTTGTNPNRRVTGWQSQGSLNITSLNLPNTGNGDIQNPLIASFSLNGYPVIQYTYKTEFGQHRNMTRFRFSQGLNIGSHTYFMVARIENITNSVNARILFSAGRTQLFGSSGRAYSEFAGLTAFPKIQRVEYLNNAATFNSAEASLNARVPLKSAFASSDHYSGLYMMTTDVRNSMSGKAPQGLGSWGVFSVNVNALQERAYTRLNGVLISQETGDIRDTFSGPHSAGSNLENELTLFNSASYSGEGSSANADNSGGAGYLTEFIWYNFSLSQRDEIGVINSLKAKYNIS
jgi:hypothetical protein